jgi:hypothetical protein
MPVPKVLLFDLGGVLVGMPLALTGGSAFRM